jgi:hypothetical protein
MLVRLPCSGRNMSAQTSSASDKAREITLAYNTTPTSLLDGAGMTSTAPSAKAK